MHDTAASKNRTGVGSRAHPSPEAVGDAGALDTIVAGTLGFSLISNMPIDATVLRKGLLSAHDLGRAVCEQVGDGSYRHLHGG
jgi:hypothetical protein